MARLREHKERCARFRNGGTGRVPPNLLGLWFHEAGLDGEAGLVAA